MLHLLVALRPEASPFVQAWKLRRDPAVKGFDLYEGSLTSDDADLPVRLVRTGLGKAQMAAGVGWLAGRSSRSGESGRAIWLNAGIAGHGSLPVGDVVMAHRVEDLSNGRASYPPLVIEPPCATCELRTVDVPETKYEDAQGVAYDMEASGFVDAARRFATAEMVHCLKVVSDGPEAPVQHLDRRRIGELSEKLVPIAEELVNRLRPIFEELQGAEDDPAEYEELLEASHYSLSDRVQLRKQLRRRQALAPDEPLPRGIATASRGKEANKVLKAWLDGMAAR